MEWGGRRSLTPRPPSVDVAFDVSHKKASWRVNVG